MIKDDSLKSNPETVTNEMTILHGWRVFAVGDTSVDPQTSAAHAVVPWIVCPLDMYLNKQLSFAAFNSGDRLVRSVVTAITSTDGGASATGQSVSLYDRQITFLSDNSYLALFLQNKNKEKKLGEGKTLTITSGGLTMNDSGTAIGTETGGSENGSLILGDANNPAYVWAQSTDPASPNEIWTPVTAPGGFVSAYTGNLVLGGDQTGIADELVVNAGTLQLGTTNSLCKLTNDLPIRIYANATLRLPNATSTKGTEIRFDGAAGWFGKVDIAAGVEARCRKLCWRDYPETPEWQYLPSGTYGSSDSDAEFIRDDLFTGAGVLTVSLEPTLILMR